MKNYTLEIFMLFIGCLMIILSQGTKSTNNYLMILGLVLAAIAIFLLIRNSKKSK